MSRSIAMASMDAEMSIPTQMWLELVRCSPERPEPQPMSRMKDGAGRARSCSARWVIEDWIDWMREEVVYLWDSVSL